MKDMTKDILKQIEKDGRITDNFIASPDPDDIYTWYFMIFGLADYPWIGGFYLGKLMFPKEYPFRPPGIALISESGRF
jgi:ubiquitin-conjugating enzyme E2 J2